MAPRTRAVLRTILTTFVVLCALAVPAFSAWRMLDGHEARQYRKFCIEHQTDQGRCEKGPAGEAKKRCARNEWPPGVTPGYAAQCEKAWLSLETNGR